MEDFLNYRNRLSLEIEPNSELDKILDLADKIHPELKRKILQKKNLTKCKYEDIERECRSLDLALSFERRDRGEKEARKDPKRKFEKDKSDKSDKTDDPKKEFKCY
jgi:hypothetical protein